MNMARTKRGKGFRVDIICESCGKSFSAWESSRRKFCSVKCYRKSITRKKRFCKMCGKPVSKKANHCRSCASKIIPQSLESRRKKAISKIGGKNPQWKGDYVGYTSLHEWVRNHKPVPDLCECCGKVKPYDLANKGVYDRNLDNWEYLCRRCHMIKDGRMNNLKQYQGVI